jgi:hypothetical protein
MEVLRENKVGSEDHTYVENDIENNISYILIQLL